MNKLECNICHHHCKLSDNQIGLCRGRINTGDKITAVNYGRITAIALDPIEKKPLRHFYPNSKILSVGSFGCNLNCGFCQNNEISMAGKDDLKTQYVTPENLVKIALDLKPEGNIGIAYTYNEPLIGYEYVMDCSKLARENGLKNVVVTNGSFCEESMKDLLTYIDALNIDLKGFTDKFYENIGGDFELVKNFIKLAYEYCHIEITTLIIPDENDSEEEISSLSQFIASINKEIPLHISRFFPCYNMMDKKPTNVNSIYRLAEVARKHLNNVYEGNV